MTLRPLFSKCRPFFVYAGLFSLVGNLLALSPSLYMLTVFDRVLSSRSNETLVVLTIIFGFALAIEAVVDAQRTQLFSRLGFVVFGKLRGAVLSAILRFRREDVDCRHALSDLEEIQHFLSGAGIKAAFEIPWIPIYLIVLWLFHPLLSVIALVSALLMFGLTYLEEIVTVANQKRASLEHRKSEAFIDEAFQNTEIVDALAMQSAVENRWGRINDRYLGEAFAAKGKVTAISAFSKFVRGVLQLASMGTAAYLVINVQGVSPGVVIASTIILGKTIAPIVMVLDGWRTFIEFRESFDRIDQLLLEQEGQDSGFRHDPPKGRLRVERLLFFLNRDRNILNGIDFALEPGDSLGIVGSSASGKTTLARLLVGLYAPSDGAVRLDGIDLNLWSRNGLGVHVGYLPQSHQLFQGTVAENICRMANPSQSADAILDAARRAMIHEMIIQLPKGYDTEVGPGGRFLSGGQRQLIALARALYGRPRLIILDEPNSNLDGPSELILLQVIRTLKAEGVTLVVVSHKPSVLQDVEHLLVLGEGRQLMFDRREVVLDRLKQQNSVALPEDVA
jgi:PrtD family type I secretion system ABC transporter